MPDVLLATCARLPDGDEDGARLLAALAERQVVARYAVWDDPTVEWNAALVVLRSTWDYTGRRGEFLDWADAVPRLANPSAIVHWSSDKTYLRDLADAGLPTVPTAVAVDDAGWDWPDADEVVVKPSVGAGSRSVGRFERSREQAARSHARQLAAAGYTALVQPYLGEVDAAGETALIHLDGEFSHAIRKSAMLPAGTVHELGSADLYIPESIAARTPSADERRVGDAVLAYVRDRFGVLPLYARVDLLPSADGPVVVELELVEPSLFFSHAPDAAIERFAGAIAAAAGV